MPKVSENFLLARKEEILNATRKAFAQFGFDSTTVKRIEEFTGYSRGTIFHHFKDKDSLFLEIAKADVIRMADVVARSGIVQVMRDMINHPAEYDWLSTRLEIGRKIRTDPQFKLQWESNNAELFHATLTRLQSRKALGKLRDDISPEILVEYLELFLEGLISRLATGVDATRVEILNSVISLVEETARPQNDISTLKTKISEL